MIYDLRFTMYASVLRIQPTRVSCYRTNAAAIVQGRPGAARASWDGQGAFWNGQGVLERPGRSGTAQGVLEAARASLPLV